MQNAHDRVPHDRQAFDAAGVHPADCKTLADLSKFPFTVRNFRVAGWFAAAHLTVPPTAPFISNGTQSRHSEHLGYILAEMQSLQGQHPGGRW